MGIGRQNASGVRKCYEEKLEMVQITCTGTLRCARIELLEKG